MSSGRLLQKQSDREKNRAWKNSMPGFFGSMPIVEVTLNENSEE